MTSNNEKKTHFKEKNYTPPKIIQTCPDRYQGIYNNIKLEDAEKLICDMGGVRDVLLEKQK